MSALFVAARIVRDGLATLYTAAQTICATTRWALPIIQEKFPNNTRLLMAMKAVQAACEELRLSIKEQKDAERAQMAPEGVPLPPAPAPTPEPESEG